MEINMKLVKKTKNFLVYENADEMPIPFKWYLPKETFKFLPELVKVTIQAIE